MWFSAMRLGKDTGRAGIETSLSSDCHTRWVPGNRLSLVLSLAAFKPIPLSSEPGTPELTVLDSKVTARL